MALFARVSQAVGRFRPRSSWRMWAHGAIAAVVVIVLVESFVTFGLVVPVRVAGSSMSPTFEGAHAEIDCPRCNWRFDVGLDQLPLDRPLLCPDCRAEFPLPEEIDHQPGERLVIDRTRHAAHNPRRWEVVVLRSSEHEGGLCVKRIVGLPGERLAFRDGDVWANGQMIRKPLDDQLALRQLVHHERDALRCWHATDPAWRWTDEGWQSEGATAALLSFAPATGAPLTDDLATNQRASRRPHLIADLMLTCRVAPLGPASLQARCTWDKRTCETAPLSMATGKDGFDLVVSWFDQQLLVAIDGQIVEQRVFADPWPGSPALELAATGSMRLSDLQVWRDIHYHTRPGDALPRGPIPREHYFVVGDNVAISSDSRNWPGAGVPLKNLVGGIVGY